MSAASPSRQPIGAEQDFIDGVIAKHRGHPGELLGILEELQEHHPHKFLPNDVLAYVASRTTYFRAQVYSVATFYALFDLKPQGEHTVCICRGTACHTRGSRGLLERVKLKLGLRGDDEAGSADKLSMTTADRRFTVRTVACFGQRALAPVVEVDHRVLGHVNRDTSLCGLGQSAPNPVLTTMRHFRHEFEDHIRAHRCRAGVCEDLALSPCENSCPLHMNIPRFLQLWKEDRLEDAFESVVLDNPLPASTGRVCQHPCEDRCRRAGMDEAVNMREVHRFIADAIYTSDRFDAMVERVKAHRQPETGKRVAVVGAGPAGVTCAFYLALLGHDVTVYEANAEAGGMLRYALPDYRLPKDVLARELELIARAGVKYVFNATVPRDVTLDDLAADHEAVFVSIGTWKEAAVHLPGADLKGVEPALLFLEGIAKGRDVELGRKVVVIGGGNAAIDSARTALRLGADVSVVYRRERKDMPAIPEETDAAEAEGAEFVFLATPHRIIGDEEGRVKAIEVVRTRLGEFDASGRRKPVSTGEIRRIACDAVILAVGEAVDGDLAKASDLKTTPAGTIEVDRYSLETSRSRFYAGGDVVSGASNVSTAMGYGKKAARHIVIPALCYMKGLSAVGACRLCMVEVAGVNRLLPACTTPAEDGMAVTTDSRRLQTYRKMALELLFAERNHVCSVCVSNNHCELQALAQRLGVTSVRYAYSFPVLPIDTSHPKYVLDHNRCVLCTRCVRVCAEVEGAHVWEVMSRGVQSLLVSELNQPWGAATDCTSCGKCVQACPTGAIAEKGRAAEEMVKRHDRISRLTLLREVSA